MFSYTYNLYLWIYTESSKCTSEFLLYNFIHTHLEKQTALRPKDPLVNPSPCRYLTFLKSWHTIYGWEMCLSLESLFFSQRERSSREKIAPKSSSARQRRIWYETDTKAERDKRIWVYSSSPRLWGSKHRQVAYLQTSNISTLFEHSKWERRSGITQCKELHCFYKHTHTEEGLQPLW